MGMEQKQKQKPISHFQILPYKALFPQVSLKPLTWYFDTTRFMESPQKFTTPYWPVTPTVRYFLFFRKSTITTFFINTMVDMPLCFKKSKSLFNQTFEIPTLRFINFLMRHGKRQLVVGRITLALNNFLIKWSSLSQGVLSFFETWHSLLTLSSTFSVSQKKLKSHATTYTHQTLSHENFIFNYRFHYNNIFALKFYLFRVLKKIKPLFSFFIQKNDKLKRKHGRGKVDKMKVMWKYVPRYKRFYQAMHWLLKDLNFQKYKKLEVRLFHVFETFLLTPELSFLTKIKNFVHSFVFKKHRKTLLETLKTSI